MPAVLGGLPAFEDPVEVVRPSLPDVAATCSRFAEVLRSRRLSNNSCTVQQFERDLAEWLDVPHAVAMSNGTLTLVLTLKALGLRGSVVVPSFTFCATVHAVVWAGLQPVFADIDPDTLNITPSSVEAVLTDDVSAVMPVNVFGSPCDIEGFERLCGRRGLRLVFDSAQAIGSTCMGRRLGSFGDVESFSVHATKLLPTGEGGVVTTENKDLADCLRRARNFGLDGDGDCTLVGLNAKMCEFPAVLGTLGLRDLDNALQRRRELAERYLRRLSDCPGLRFQEHLQGCGSNNQNLVTMVDEDAFGLSRDELDRALNAENIICRRYFYPAMHLTTAYKETFAGGCVLPATEHVARRCLCLPIHSDMTVDTVDRICDAALDIAKQAPQVRLMLAGGQEASIPVRTVSIPRIKEDRPVCRVTQFAKPNLCVCLPSRPKELYEEMGVMLLDVLSDSDWRSALVRDGDRTALTADALLMIGDCMEFESYAALLRGMRDRRPVTALWLLDTLPPAILSEKAARIGSRLRLYNEGLRIIRTYMRPVRKLIPLSLRRKMGLSACSILLHGIRSATNSVTESEVRKLDLNSQYEILGRYEWIDRNYSDGWIDRIFVNTMPKRSFLASMGIPADFIPLGFHPNMGDHTGIERDIDVLFIGELEYGRRKAIVEYVQQDLEKRGRRVTVIGSGCYGDARIEMMNRAKISLNVPRFPWDIPTIRVFLSIGCGSLVVSEEMGDTAPFESGRHLVQAGVTDLADVICHYLEHDNERQEIVDAASELVCGDLTLARSVSRVLGEISADERLAA